MVARILHAGGEIETVRTFSPLPSIITNNTAFDPDYSRCALGFSGGVASRIWEIPLINTDGSLAVIPSGSTAWFHSLHHFGGNNSTGPIWEIYDSSARPFFRLLANGTVQHNVSATSTPSWSTIGTVVTGSGLKNIDISITLNTPSAINIYIANVASGSFAIETPTYSNVGSVLVGISKAGTSGIAAVSQTLVTEDIPTVNSIVQTIIPQSDGAVSEWDGSASSINGTAIDDQTFISSDAPDQVSTFEYSGTTTPEGYKIESVFLWNRGRNDLTDPSQIEAVARVSGVNYNSPALSGLDVGFSPLGTQWTRNPATSEYWDDASIDGAEFGVESKS